MIYLLAIFNRQYLMIYQELDNYAFIIRQLLPLSIQPVYHIKVNRAIYSKYVPFYDRYFHMGGPTEHPPIGLRRLSICLKRRKTPPPELTGQLSWNLLEPDSVSVSLVEERDESKSYSSKY